MQNYARISIFGIVALVLLRVTVGWHFYMEGVSKIQGGSFSSVGFLQSSRGPLAENFRSMIWDHDGRFRLNQEQVTRAFDNAAKRAVVHFSLTDEQRLELDRIRRQYIDKLGDVYAEADEDIFKYWESTQRLAKMRESEMWSGVASMRGQREKIEEERMQGVRSTLASIDAIWKQYEGRINSVANSEQLASVGYFRFTRPGEGLLSARVVDQAIPIFDMSVGILLMIGLLTPLASWVGALFLLSVILAQMPGYPGTEPTYFQAIEAVALVTLACTDAGRYAGLDFLPWAWWQKRREQKLAMQAV